MTSLIVNKPNRVYISSYDSTSYSQNNSRFDISFEDPIYEPKGVALVSAEYSNSFYNVLSSTKFSFNETYRDTNGVIKARINFSVSGLVEDHYNATELATALTTKLNAGELVGTDSDPNLTMIYFSVSFLHLLLVICLPILTLLMILL